jgi:hypothetical protein
MKLQKLRTGLCLGALALVAAVMLAGGGGPLTNAPRNGALGITGWRHRPALIHRLRDQTSTETYNWSGYAVTGAKGSVTAVKGSWVVPSVKCTSNPDGYAAFWTGIDGWTSNTVEQIGTDSDCVNLEGTKTGTPTYYAWFEFYPRGSYLIGSYNRNGVCTADCVAPGDVISAEVTASGNAAKGRFGGQPFTVTLTDETKGWTFTTTTTVSGAQQTSAEWIAETPYGCSTASGFCPLADFGVADYGYGYTNVLNTASATVSGVTQALGSFGGSVQEAIMVNYPSGTTTMAEPSSLQNSGTSFIVPWYNAGP